MERYLFCVSDICPATELVIPESAADRREREAERLEVAPEKPGEDPPTYGDEGGGTLYPEREAPAPTLLQRLLRRVSGRG